jgi:hypothetical protein
VGILAVVAAFSSGIFALQRASQVATASTLADAQMELYRAIKYTAIELDDNTTKNLTDATYKADPVLGGNVDNSVTTTTGCTTLPNECNPSRSVTGPDRYPYRVDTYVTTTTPTSGRPVKLVTVVIRDGKNLAKTLARQQSTFDESTGV